ncbi:MAG: hypothetical protein NZ954_03020 [Thermofilaceae archaeon]|nr:hypothetical protein [Thermofilaceae archaeon]MDW8004509.1 hypothetical protein [Thermofilaceae archaeon]
MKNSGIIAALLLLLVGYWVGGIEGTLIAALAAVLLLFPTRKGKKFITRMVA